jgi:RHS repeat-associated protein
MYCQNNNYNVVALTDSTGAVVERVSYSAYGQPTCTRVSDGHTQTASHFDNPWLFQGQRYCPESGLYYSNERYYSPALGRFIQPDLTDYPDGMNRFECMRSNTLNGVDPYGLQKIELKVKEDESDHGSANLWEMLNYGAKRRWGSTPKVSGNVANLNVWSIAQGIGTCSSNSNFVQAKVAGSGEGTVTLKVTVQYALLAQVSVPGNYGGSAVAQVHVFGLNGGTLDHAETPPTMSQSQPFRMSNVVTGVLNGEIKGFPCDGKFRTIASATDDATINPTGPAVAGDSELRAVARKAVVRGQAKAVVSVTLE